MKISEWIWKSFDGLDMYSRGWEPEGQPKAVIVLVHGLGEHCARYNHVGAALTEKGYALLGFDLRGHGKSGGPRGHSPSIEAFMQDIDLMFKQADVRYPGIRQFIYGHSLGGALVLNYVLLRRKPALAGAVVTAPALRTALEEQKGKVMLAKVLGALLPSVTLPSGLDANMLSHIPEVVDRYKQDPLVHDRVSFGMGKNLLEMSPWIFEHAGEFNIPLLLMHGTEDKIAFSRGSQEFAEKAGDKVTLKLWDGLYHEIHNEPEKAEVFKVMLDWLEKHYPG
jgi:alpha-beta hydrolase superfamily lysophospholipase